MSEKAMQKYNSQGAVAEAEQANAVTLQPPVDILETDDEYFLIADLPGVNPQDVDVRFENGELLLHGKRSASNVDKQRACWEYDVTHYHRAFRIHENIAADKISADMNSGVLTLRLPKVDAAKPRKIAVKG